MVTLRVDNRVRFPIAGMTPAVLEELARAFTYKNPDADKWKRLGLYGKGPPKWVSTWKIEQPREEWSVPRGGLARVQQILDRAGVAWEVLDARIEGPGRWEPLVHRVELRPFQRDLVQSALEAETCLWRAPAGSGKTTAALAFVAEVRVPTLVVVWTTNLLDQWVRRCRAELGFDPGVIQGSKRTVRRVTVGMQQTLCKCIDDYADDFGAVVCDEVQRFAASTFGAVVDALPAKYRLGVSADERRSDRKQFLIYDHFGGVAEEVSHDELVADGIIHEVAIRVVPTDFRADWWHDVPPSERTEQYDRLLGELSGDAERNALIGRVVGWSLDEKEQVLVLTQRREHAHVLDTAMVALGVPSGLLIGGDDYREQYERARRGLEAGTVRAAVGTYQAVGTGIDLPRVARGVLALPVANSEAARPQWLQYRGRFARTAEGKSDAVVYYLWDRNVFGVRPLRNLCRWNHVVTVLESDGRWRSGHEVVKELDDENEKRKEDRDTDDLGGIFLRR